MTTYIQVPDNLYDKSIKIVSTKYQSDEFNDDTRTIVLKSKLSAMQQTIEELRTELNNLSATTQQYVNASTIASNNNVVQTTNSDTDQELALIGDDAESEVKTWANGEKTKDYRYMLVNNEDDTYMSPFEYIVPSDSELATRFFIQRIKRIAIDSTCILTIITFSNGKILTINGLLSNEYGGPFITYNEMSYHIGYQSQIWNNTFENTVSAITSLTINTYVDGAEEDWILLELENGKLTFWKRHWIRD